MEGRSVAALLQLIGQELGKAASASLVSCRQTTSGRRSSSQGSRRGRRCLTELTFHVAIRISAHRSADGGWWPSVGDPVFDDVRTQIALSVNAV